MCSVFVVCVFVCVNVLFVFVCLFVSVVVSATSLMLTECFLFSLQHLLSIWTHEPVFSLIHVTYLLMTTCPETHPSSTPPLPSETAGGICLH